MTKDKKNTEKQCDIHGVSSSCFDSKPITEIEYLEYMNKKAKTINTIIYPFLSSRIFWETKK